MNYGDDVVDGIARHGDNFMERYAKSGDEFVEEFLEKGDEVFAGGTQGGGVYIVKETENYIDYLNNGGNKIRIPKQSSKSIDSAITALLESSNEGDRVEAKVACFIKNDLGIELTDFRNKVKDTTGQVIADIDCATQDVLIEVKASISSVKYDQFVKYLDNSSEKYINISSKKVVLYIDKPL